jgi:hypothetical protein
MPEPAHSTADLQPITPNSAADRLAANAEAIRALATCVSAEQARWRPSDEAWSLLETVCHLADEEREDFRVRLEFTLLRPGEAWPPIDPAGWVSERRYNEGNLDAALADFLAERARNAAWLRGLSAEEPALETAYEHPQWGPVPAGDILAAWLSHDQLHLRQLTELHYAWTKESSRPYDTRYAGEW